MIAQHTLRPRDGKRRLSERGRGGPRLDTHTGTRLLAKQDRTEAGERRAEGQMPLHVLLPWAGWQPQEPREFWEPGICSGCVAMRGRDRNPHGTPDCPADLLLPGGSAFWLAGSGLHCGSPRLPSPPYLFTLSSRPTGQWTEEIRSQHFW